MRMCTSDWLGFCDMPRVLHSALDFEWQVRHCMVFSELANMNTCLPSPLSLSLHFLSFSSFFFLGGGGGAGCIGG